MSTPQDQYVIDRKTASRLLKVSIRTVDRYIRQNRLSSQVMSGRIWLNKAEIRTLKDVKRPKVEIVNVDMSTLKMSIDKNVYVDVDTDEEMSTLSTREAGEDKEVYKNLYEKTLEEVRRHQEQLNRATYHIGQLEARIKYSVPLLQYHKEKKLLKATNERLDQELDNALKKIKKIGEEFRIERFNKHIYLIILIGVLIIQPIFWFIVN